MICLELYEFISIVKLAIPPCKFLITVATAYSFCTIKKLQLDTTNTRLNSFAVLDLYYSIGTKKIIDSSISNIDDRERAVTIGGR